MAERTRASVLKQPRRGVSTVAGEYVPACKRLAGDVEYLIFGTRIACETERKAQKSNEETAAMMNRLRPVRRPT